MHRTNFSPSNERGWKRFADVRLYGDIAVVLPHYRQTALVNGVPRSGEFLITDVWVKRNGTWQVVARSSIMIPEGSG
jgi:hypothetical protein